MQIGKVCNAAFLILIISIYSCENCFLYTRQPFAAGRLMKIIQMMTQHIKITIEIQFNDHKLRLPWMRFRHMSGMIINYRKQPYGFS